MEFAGCKNISSINLCGALINSVPEHYEKIDTPEKAYNSTYSDRG